jgi:nucleoside-diphosphate-sugar epimerase
MRFDLVVNAMFKTAVSTGVITMSNPAIWRPILSIKDCVSAYIRAIECDRTISGVFNIASENCTIGQIADIVKDTVENSTGMDLKIVNNNVKDVRNYKVACDKAKTVLGFSPICGVKNIVEDLLNNRQNFGDMDNPAYYNIKTFIGME